MLVVQHLKKFFFCWLTSTFLSSLHVQAVGSVAFLPGEKLEYQVYYSFIHAGTATMSVDEQLHKLNERLCYKVQVKGASSHGLDLLGIKLLNQWVSYLEVDSAFGLRPHRSLSHLQENGYVRKEQVDFDYQSNKARVAVAESIHNMEHKVTYHSIAKNMQDLLGGYYALRSIDTTKLKPGDKLITTVLYEEQLYENVAIVFLGKKTIETKLGKASALVFAPLVPVEDSIFSGQCPVEAYISDDGNKIPLKLKVNLVVGSVEIVLTDYKGLKEPIHFQAP